MYCKNCGSLLGENQAVCLQCGAKAGDGSTFCANCGQPIDPNASICLSCGAAVKNGNLNGKDKVTMALICFFLGALGIHNFMMGETKKGIFKIVLTCCFGLGAIFALIDFVRILTDSYEVNPDKLV